MKVPVSVSTSSSRCMCYRARCWHVVHPLQLVGHWVMAVSFYFYCLGRADFTCQWKEERKEKNRCSLNLLLELSKPDDLKILLDQRGFRYHEFQFHFIFSFWKLFGCLIIFRVIQVLIGIEIKSKYLHISIIGKKMQMTSPGNLAFIVNKEWIHFFKGRRLYCIILKTTTRTYMETVYYC